MAICIQSPLCRSTFDPGDSGWPEATLIVTRSKKIRKKSFGSWSRWKTSPAQVSALSSKFSPFWKEWRLLYGLYESTYQRLRILIRKVFLVLIKCVKDVDAPHFSQNGGLKLLNSLICSIQCKRGFNCPFRASKTLLFVPEGERQRRRVWLIKWCSRWRRNFV